MLTTSKATDDYVGIARVYDTSIDPKTLDIPSLLSAESIVVVQFAFI